MPLGRINEYEINYELRPNYLLVTVRLARNEYNIANQYWSDVVRLAHKGKYTRVIVDISAPFALPAKDARSLMMEFARRIAPDIKVAIVNSLVIDSVRSAVESSASIDGRSIKIFDTLHAAEAWLLGKSTAESDAETGFQGKLPDPAGIQDQTHHQRLN